MIYDYSIPEWIRYGVKVIVDGVWNGTFAIFNNGPLILLPDRPYYQFVSRRIYTSSVKFDPIKLLDLPGRDLTDAFWPLDRVISGFNQVGAGSSVSEFPPIQDIIITMYGGFVTHYFGNTLIWDETNYKLRMVDLDAPDVVTLKLDGETVAATVEQTLLIFDANLNFIGEYPANSTSIQLPRLSQVQFHFIKLTVRPVLPKQYNQSYQVLVNHDFGIPFKFSNNLIQ